MRPLKDATLVTGLSNREFLEKYAAPGRVGLCGGTTLVDQAICRAERHLDERHRWGCWSHAFLFEGRRVDGHHWVLESDLQVLRKNIQLGVQENRLSKYFDEELYTVLGVLDFGLTEAQVSSTITEGLDRVATRTRYSVRELVGTLLALKHSELRARANLFARESSMYCSAFVQHVFRTAGVDLAPGVELKNTTPEDIAHSPVPHQFWVLRRAVAESRIETLKRRLKARARLARVRRATARPGS
jgi:hypothetical protein